ncbi:thioredoxin family protein [Nocardioides sp.]|uniref:thioredoxin family protein n=1 Tax=Nocardioides sp. TaxID=35761 RepID=UPI002B272EAC|nr:thioredoxin family protein [Nocardioides sp.]
MSTGAWVAIAAVVVALAFGLYRARTDGRYKQTAPSKDTATETTAPSLLADTPWVDQVGERATLLQFSSAFCAPCRATRRILTDVAAETDGIAHIEVDAEEHLDVVRRLGIMRTPTTIVLDRSGHELGRAVGAPTKAQVLASLPDPV